MSLEFFPSSVLLLFDALLLLLRYLLVSSFLPELSLDFRALIVDIIVSKVLVCFLVSDVSKVFKLLKSFKRQQDVFCPKGLQNFGLSFSRFLPISISVSFAENDGPSFSSSLSSSICESTCFRFTDLMGRRQMVFSLCCGFGGIALGVTSTNKVLTIKREMSTISVIMNAITIIEIEAAIFSRLL